MPEDKAPLIDYAPAPRSMTKARLAFLIGGISGATILIAGTTYELVSSTTRPVLMGEIAAPAPLVRPTTVPCLPGMPLRAATTQFSPATQPVEK